MICMRSLRLKPEHRRRHPSAWRLLSSMGTSSIADEACWCW